MMSSDYISDSDLQKLYIYLDRYNNDRFEDSIPSYNCCYSSSSGYLVKIWGIELATAS